MSATFPPYPPKVPVTVLALDLAWGGTGWCVCSPNGQPAAAGHIVLGGGDHRFYKLQAFLDEVSRLHLEGVEVLAPLIEQPALVYQGATRAGGAGNQMKVGRAMGRIIGGVEMYFTPWMVAGRAYEVLLVEPQEWRGWWGLNGGTRGVVKHNAVKRVRMMGWGKLLEGHGEDVEGELGDVAEAILQATGYSRHLAEYLPKPPGRVIKVG